MNKFVNFRFWLLPFGNKHIDIKLFSLVHGQVNWKQFLVRSNKWTTRTTRAIDLATPDINNVQLTSLSNTSSPLPFINVLEYQKVLSA